MDKRESQHRLDHLKGEDWFPAHSIEKALGFEVSVDENGEVVVCCPIDKRHLNLLNNVHGGVIAALADTAAGIAYCVAYGDIRPSATVDLHISYISSVQSGELKAETKVLRKEGRIGFVECNIVDDKGNLIARGTGTFTRISMDAIKDKIDDA